MTSSFIVAVALVIVLLALAGLHAYWGIGGRWGRSGVTPQVSGQAALNTGPWACAVVVVLLATAAAVVAARGGLFAHHSSHLVGTPEKLEPAA